MNVFAQKSIESIRYEGILQDAMTQSYYDEISHYSPTKLLEIYYDLTHFCYIENQLPANCAVMGDLCNFVSPDQECDDESVLVSTKMVNHRKYALPQEDSRYCAFSIGTSGYYVIVVPVEKYVKQKAAFFKEYGY